MARILVVYGTTYGQTQRVGRRTVDRLADSGHELSMYKGDHLPGNLSLDEYDAFVVAASIIGGRHQRYTRDFVRKHVVRLNAAPSAFVSICGAAAASPAPAGEYLQEFLRQTGWRPAFSASFAGAIAYTRYGWVLRWIMRMISRKNGGPTDTTCDHELTDWNAVDCFAEQLSHALPAPGPSSPVRSPGTIAIAHAARN